MSKDELLKTGDRNEFEKAMLQAQQSGLSSWQNVVGEQNRFLLIDNILSPKLRAYRNAAYTYHRLGLDMFSSNKKIIYV